MSVSCQYVMFFHHPCVPPTAHLSLQSFSHSRHKYMVKHRTTIIETDTPEAFPKLSSKSPCDTLKIQPPKTMLRDIACPFEVSCERNSQRNLLPKQVAQCQYRCFEESQSFE